MILYMKKKTVSIILLVAIIGTIWLPPFFKFYSFNDALIITISAISGGFIAELLLKKK